MESLANNRMAEIGRLLGPPGLDGDAEWNGLVTAALSALLVWHLQELLRVKGDSVA